MIPIRDGKFIALKKVISLKYWPSYKKWYIIYKDEEGNPKKHTQSHLDEQFVSSVQRALYRVNEHLYLNRKNIHRMEKPYFWYGHTVTMDIRSGDSRERWHTLTKEEWDALLSSYN